MKALTEADLYDYTLMCAGKYGPPMDGSAEARSRGPQSSARSARDEADWCHPQQRSRRGVAQLGRPASGTDVAGGQATPGSD
jgi:hypothetical protein